MAILALGKLGSRQMTLRSDLDLIMVYDVPLDRPPPTVPSRWRRTNISSGSPSA